jgi:hypothetical protein
MNTHLWNDGLLQDHTALYIRRLWPSWLIQVLNLRPAVQLCRKGSEEVRIASIIRAIHWWYSTHLWNVGLRILWWLRQYFPLKLRSTATLYPTKLSSSICSVSIICNYHTDSTVIASTHPITVEKGLFNASARYLTKALIITKHGCDVSVYNRFSLSSYWTRTGATWSEWWAQITEILM